jgi:carbon monoxide dehydrogenase subunit G
VRSSALSSFYSKSKYYLLIGCCISILLTACRVSYSLNGASIPPEAKTVSVTFFQNYASLAPPTLSQKFTEALRTRLSSQSRLTLIPKEGDLAFEGSITGYATSPVGIQSTDVAAQTRLTITVNVKYTCSFDEKKNFEQSFSKFADYKSDQSLAAVESRLIDDINDQLTQDIFNKALNNW